MPFDAELPRGETDCSGMTSHPLQGAGLGAEVLGNSPHAAHTSSNNFGAIREKFFFELTTSPTQGAGLQKAKQFLGSPIHSI